MSNGTTVRTAQVLGLKRPIARLLESSDGGPVRRIVDGRKTVYTGFFIAAKANFTQMPWESRNSERTIMMLAEASTRVVSLLAQPHRLEIFVNEQAKPLVYFPDLQLEIHPSLFDDLVAGTPFSIAALAPSLDEADSKLKTVILEIKDDRDRRQFTQKYVRKLELAREVYRRLGMTFLTVQRMEDIYPYHLRIASSVVSWRHTAVNQLDVWSVKRTLQAASRQASEVIGCLGGAAVGWAKLRAMHVRRIVELDLTEPVSPNTTVTLLRNNTRYIQVKS